ncbi:acetyl-CoA C-acetyltransferase [Pseudonocardia bannensis]|uniref:acetyl-CoA C-acyltransferase n=1 Tax=Pseudonocardia bannensis TaxID=630973 RepID=A0A848DD94_9PSEU|nr:acetyl-CoA C-acetyltransferase [Pseudonocardia bannensis]NMH90566.1 acetyl-CoA C-acetyltransferase [Pseudonocardia bannensis]
MVEAVIVAATRTAVGRARKGALAAMRADDLAATVARAALDQARGLDADELDDLYLGVSNQTGEQAQNLGRRVAVLLGADTLPAATVSRACSSSVQTARMAFHAIKAGEGDAFLSVGVECVSRYTQMPTPATDNPLFAAARERSAVRAAGGDGAWTDPRRTGGLPDFYLAMGQTAENVAALCGVSRREQDEFALRSQERYAAALAAGVPDREITPVTLPDGTVFAADESPRPATTAEGLAALAPVFRPNGTVTAGNCCPLNDGAAAVVITSDVRAAELGLAPRARIVATGVSGLSPEIMGLGPVEASRRALARARMSISDVDLVEINEAFAAQVIPCQRELGVDPERLNVHGGAIALGHPFGMTGARIMTTLLTALETRDAQVGLVTMCVGSGQGMALVLERLG